MPIMKALLLSTLLSASFALAQAPGATGSLQGSVTDPQGLPIAGAVVRYQSIPPSVAAGTRPTPAPWETFASGTVATDANGRFTVPGLPSAPHLLCASVPSAPYLDPCIWGQAVRTTVSAGVTTSQNLVLVKGVYLNVRVNDPMHVLPQEADGPWTPRKLLVGVAYGTGAYQAARNTAVDSAGRDYKLIIPAGQPFQLWLYSTDLALTDASGAAVTSPAGGVAFQASSGQDRSFTFTVAAPGGDAQ
jgi:hypothetical protein